MLYIDNPNIKEIKNLVPLSIKILFESRTCIDHPCSTCAAHNLEKTFLDIITSYKFFLNKQNRNKSDKEIFEEALCKMDMNQVKKFDKKVRGGFYGGWIPFWVKVIRNLRRNDPKSPKWLIFLEERKFINFNLDFTKIYSYWLKNKLNDLELIDFMIYYDRFVPEDKKIDIMKIGKSLVKENFNESLNESISYRLGLI